MHKLIFIIGASGSGKTTALEAFEARPESSYKTLFFDSIGVPSPEEMEAQYGSGDNWQKVTTEQWVKRIKNEFLETQDVILDGQIRPSFITDACKKYAIPQTEIILFDCTNEVRTSRLNGRGQPELANDRMMNWAKYLRDSIAEGPQGFILDNSELTLEQTVDELAALLQ